MLFRPYVAPILAPYALHPTTPTATSAARKIIFSSNEKSEPKKPRPDDGALPARAPEAPTPARSGLRMREDVVTEIIL